uniref:Bifunctional inhibitor/plant lipid transfer protein/seed storage helical domain-containing protein n=1 Tax=Kalanchoe fedtschenkoi TaxID=63787 RepID=A0A7N0TME1_KALFE
MERFQVFQQAIAISAVMLLIGVSVRGQITTPCTSSMVSSFTPCFNFITGSSSTGASPSADCCTALKELTSTSRDCTCLIINAGVPISLPINRTLAISLPRACNMPGVPIQCKATGSPLPAPGPAAFGPAAPPTAAESPLSPTSSKASTLPPLPSTEIPTDSTPASSPTESDTPTAVAGIKPVQTPSTATYPYFSVHSKIIPLLFLVVVMVY